MLVKLALKISKILLSFLELRVYIRIWIYHF